LQPRQDSTNLSLEPLRNRVRLELLPLLQSYNPQVKEALQRTAQIAGDDIDYLEKNAAHLYQKLAVRQLENILLDKKSLLKQPISMRRYILRLAIENAAGNLKDIEARHIEELVTALEKPAGFYLSSFRCVTAFVAGEVAKNSGPAPYIMRHVLGVQPQAADAAAPRVSGALDSHYAPRTPVALVDLQQLTPTLQKLAAAGRRVLKVKIEIFDSAAKYIFAACPSTPNTPLTLLHLSNFSKIYSICLI